jgi:hypothetical protein
MPSSYVSCRVINDQTEHSRPIIVGYVSSGHYFEGHKNQTKQPCTAFHFHKVPVPSDHESSTTNLLTTNLQAQTHIAAQSHALS